MSINKQIKKTKKSSMPKQLHDQISHVRTIPTVNENGCIVHPYGERFIIEDRDKSIGGE